MVSAVIATLKDGRVIAKADITAVGRSDAGKLSISATLTHLKTVEYVLQTNLDADPNANFSVERPSIAGNVVGITVYVGSGTTLTGEVIGIGF